MDKVPDEVNFVEVDVAESPGIVQSADITGTPTVQ